MFVLWMSHLLYIYKNAFIFRNELGPVMFYVYVRRWAFAFVFLNENASICREIYGHQYHLICTFVMDVCILYIYKNVFIFRNKLREVMRYIICSVCSSLGARIWYIYKNAFVFRNEFRAVMFYLYVRR